jgi:hypothetical protein
MESKYWQPLRKPYDLRERLGEAVITESDELVRIVASIVRKMDQRRSSE